MSEFIAKFRERYPEYNDMPDDQLASALHKKYYSDIPVEQFNQKIGLQPPAQEPLIQKDTGITAQPRPQEAPAPMTGYGASSGIPIQQQEPQQPIDGYTGAAAKAPEQKSMLELINSKISEIGSGVVSGAERAIPQAKLQIAGLLQQGEMMTPEQFEEEKSSIGMKRFGGDYGKYSEFERSINPLSSWLADKGKQISQETRSEMEPSEFEKGSLGYYSEAISGSVINMLPMLGVSLLGRRPDIGLGVMLAQSKGGAYESGRLEGLNPQEADKYSTLISAAEAIPSAIPVMTLLKPTGKILTDMARAGVSEGGQEAITQALQAGVDKGYINPEMTMGEALDRMAEGAIIGAGAGSTMSLATGKVADKLNKREQEKLIQDQIEKEFDASLPDAKKAAIDALSPDSPNAKGKQATKPDPVKPAATTKEFEIDKAQATEQAAVPIDLPEEKPTKQRVTGKEVIEAPVSEITVSDDVPQFKEGADKKGVVEPLGGKFERTGVAPIQVWVREDGRKEVISGRHRLDLAERSGEETIPAQYHYESEGFGVDQAAVLDAMLNIREGQGKVKDYVDFIKATKPRKAEADAQGILARQTGKRAFTIATEGSDALITSHRNDQLTDEAATRIAEAAPRNENLQAVGIKAIQDGKSIAVAENMVKAVKTMTDDTAQESGDLFGFDDSAMMEAESLAKAAVKKQNQIQKTLSAVQGAAKRPDLAAKEGVDVKSPEAINKRIAELKDQKREWQNWHTNPELTKELKAGEFDLASETESQRQEREASEKQAQAERDKTAAAEEAKAQADKDADNFVLQGSDRDSDAAAARGQTDIFDAPAPKEKFVQKSGVKVSVPEISQDVVDQYNQSTFRGKGRDLNKEMRDTANSIIEDLESTLTGKDYYLGTPKQEAEASRLITEHMKKVADFNRWQASQAANNPSWVVTGRSGRNMDKAAAKSDRSMKEFQKRVDELERDRQAIKEKLYDMRPDAIKKSQQQTKSFKDIGNNVGEIATYLREGKQEIAKDVRKWAAPKALKAVESSLESDRDGTIDFLKKMDEKLSDLGGLSKVVGPRSKLAKLYADLSKGETETKDTAPEAPSYSSDPAKAHQAFVESIADESATVESIKANAERLIENKDAIIAKMSERSFTKAMLQDIAHSPRTDLKKPEMVKAAYEAMLSAHVMGSATFTIFGGSQSFEQQIMDKVKSQTQADVDSAYESQREAKARVKQRKDEFVKALSNPETLPEFKEFIRVRGKDSMTTEQLAAYDELVAESIQETKPEPIQAETIETERAQTKHTKTGVDLFVVKMKERVEKDKFRELSAKAKQLGGYYSSYSKGEAIPGFQFKTVEAADQFEQLLSGKDVDKSNFAEAKADVKQAKNAEKLLAMADKMEAKATEEINRPRETNTARRASMAANARERAEKQLALARTVRNIAVKLQDGEVKHLGKMSQVTQLEELISIQNRAIPNELYEAGSYDGYSMNRSLKEGVTVDDYIDRVELPIIELDKSIVEKVADSLKGKRGYARLSAELRRLPKGSRDSLRKLTKEQGDKIMAAQKAGLIEAYSLSFLPDRVSTLNRLGKLGIETSEQLRAAIRELESLRVAKRQEDQTQKLERDLVGKKIEGFFPTPKPLVEQMIDYADIKPGHDVLEPSAGKGDIADQIMTSAPDSTLDVVEFNSSLASILDAKGYNVVGNDFIQYSGKQYDRIVMNPPFEKFQDIDHVKHAYDLLRPGGKLVAIMGAGVKNSRKKAVEFREWLDESGSFIEDLPEGSFKDSERSTSVNTVMVTIEKNDTNTLEYERLDSKMAATPKEGEQVYNAPGHNFLGMYRSTGIPERREYVTIEGRRVNIPQKPQRIEPIMNKLVQITGPRIYYGKIKGKSAEGFYRPDVGEIRTRRKNDVEVLAHEMAHYLDVYSNVTLPNFQKLYKDPKYANEVSALSYTDADPKIQKMEGFAEFVRLWLTNANEAQLRAPKFYEAFTNTLARDRKLLNPMRDMQDLMHKFYFQGPDKLGQALIGQDMAFNQRFNEWTYRRDSRIRQQTIDRFHAARKIEQELTGKVGAVEDSAWKQLRIANGGAESISDYILNYGTVQFDEKGDLKRSGKSLHEVMEPVKTIKRKPEHKGDQKLDLLMRYFAGRRALELHRQGRENLIPKETAKEWARLGSDYPVFESIHKEYQAFNDRMMDFYQESGMITPEARKAMQSMNKDYVPFNRIRDQLAGGRSAGSAGFQKLKGGTANLNDIMVNIQDGVMANVRMALNNRAKQRLYQYISSHRDGAIFATRIAPDSKPVQVHTEEMQAKISKVLKKSGIEIEGGLSLDSKELLTFWQHGVKPTVSDSGNMVDSVIINGKVKYYEVQDPLLQDMLLSMNPESYSAFMNVMFGVKNFFTRAITLGIEFTGANLVRDTVGATFLSKNNFTPFIDSFKGMYSFFAKDQYYQDFIRSGGGYSGRLEGATRDTQARRRVSLDEFGVMTGPERLLSTIDNLASAFEYGTRIGEFRLAKKNGKSDMEAGFDAREISTDFNVHGANHFLTGYIRTVPFLNAMIQSQDRVYREALVRKKYDGNPTGMAMKAFLGITVPTLLLYLLNKDDEDYQEIPDYEKRTNWHIPLGNGQFAKIPRPYDVGFIYATMPELFAKYLEDENGKEFADGMIWTIAQMYGVDGTPAIATGWWDLVRNEKWTGAPVVPQSLANVAATEQYTSNTSETFVRLGQALNMSPIKAEHMFNAYTGYLGGYLLAGTDHMMWDEERFGEKPEKKLSENVFLSRFLTPEVRPSTSNMDKFFELKEKSDKIVSTFRETIDVRRQIKGQAGSGKFKDDTFFGLSAEEKEVLFALNDSMNKLVKLIYGKEGIKTAELSIRYDKSLSGKQKRDKIDELWKQKNKAFQTYYKQADQALQKAKRKAKQEK